MLFRLPGSNRAREKIIPTRENSEKYAREIFFCTREKISKKPVSALKNDKLGVKKVRKSGRETLTLHVKKSKKGPKPVFTPTFVFTPKKKYTGLRVEIQTLNVREREPIKTKGTHRWKS